MVKIGQSQTKHPALNNLTNESKPTSHVYFGFSFFLLSRTFCRWYEQCETFQCELLKSFGCQCRGASTYDFYRFMVLVRRGDTKKTFGLCCFWLYIHGKYLCCLWHQTLTSVHWLFHRCRGFLCPCKIRSIVWCWWRSMPEMWDKFAYLDAKRRIEKKWEKKNREENQSEQHQTNLKLEWIEAFVGYIANICAHHRDNSTLSYLLLFFFQAASETCRAFFLDSISAFFRRIFRSIIIFSLSSLY